MAASVGIVVPAFHPVVETLVAFVHDLDDTLSPDVIRIELDDPRDGVEARLADCPAEVNAVPERRGKGGAITAGFEALDTDVLAFADADASTPAASVGDVLAPVLAGEADLGVGSRRHPDATIVSHQTLARRRLGDGFAWLARRMLDASLYDYQCGAKAVTREGWEQVRGHLYEPGFAWDIELVAIAGAMGLRIAEIPVVWEDKPESTVSPVGTTLELGRALLTSRHRAKRLRGSSVHGAIAAQRDDGNALVDRLAADPEER